MRDGYLKRTTQDGVTVDRWMEDGGWWMVVPLPVDRLAVHRPVVPHVLVPSVSGSALPGR